MFESAGKQENVIIKISGMSCQHCVQQVENALQQSRGISKVQVNLAEEKAHIEYDSSVIKVDDLLQVIRDAGYEGALPG